MAVLPVPPWPLAMLIITAKSSGSLSHHRFAALGTIHLKAGNPALMGDFGPASRTDAGVPRSYPAADSLAVPCSSASTALASACSSTACSSWHGLISSLIFSN